MIMAGNGLSELLNLTDNVMKSISTRVETKSNAVLKNSGNPNVVGSPFESPRSIESQSDKRKALAVENGEPSFPRGIDSQPSFPRGIDSQKTKPSDGNQGRSDRRFDAEHEDKSSSTSKGFDEVSKVNRKITDIGRSDELEDDFQGTVQSSRFIIESNIDSKSKDARPEETTREQGKSISANSVSQDFNGEEPQIIDIQARTIEFSMSDVGEYVSCEDQALEESQCLSGQFFPVKSFGKTTNLQSHILKQGALSKGVVDPTRQTMFDDVYISQFHSTDSQKGIRETLAKRSENGKPKKQQVQAQFIRSHSRSGDESDKDSVRYQATQRNSKVPSQPPETDPNVAAAVAASAAVAVTQPFIKAQQELESRMQQLLLQLSVAQEESKEKQDTRVSKQLNSTHLDNIDTNSGKRISELERQVAELNERRLEHVETLQQQQMQMQAQLLMMSRSKSPKNYVTAPARQASPPRVLQGSRIPQAVTKSSSVSRAKNYRNSHHEPNSSYFNPDTLSKHHKYLSEVRELQGSLFDTPAPRKNVPEPTPYSLLDEPQANLGFLQELLNQKDALENDTTFSVKGNKSPGYRHNR